MSKRIFAATGHRPSKLGGHIRSTDARLLQLARAYLVAHRPDECISGMALGWDSAWSLAALELGIPLVAALPCLNQDKHWPQLARDRYNAILAQAAEVVYVSERYTADCMHRRDCWMVDHANLVVALWNGQASGTGHTVRYATERGVAVVNLWDFWQGGAF